MENATKTIGQGSVECAPIEARCKGLEVELPAGVSFDGKSIRSLYEMTSW